MKQRTLMLGMVLGSGLVILALVGLALLPSVVQASALGQTATPSATTPDIARPGMGGFRFHHGGSKTLITATANVTGLTVQEVLTQLQSGQTLAQIAEANGKTADQVIEAARALLQEQLAQDVAAGWLTQTRADAALTRFDETAPDLVNSALNFGRGPGLGGHGHGNGKFGRGGGGALLSATASVTGLTTDEVLTQLQSGQTLAQIAEANGKTADDVIAAARAQLEERLAQAVTAGRITQAQADAKLANFDSTAAERMNSVHIWQHHGPHGQWPSDNNSAPEATPAPSTISLDA